LGLVSVLCLSSCNPASLLPEQVGGKRGGPRRRGLLTRAGQPHWPAPCLTPRERLRPGLCPRGSALRSEPRGTGSALVLGSRGPSLGQPLVQVLPGAVGSCHRGEAAVKGLLCQALLQALRLRGELLPPGTA